MRTLLILASLFSNLASADTPRQFQSHSPTRPLPSPTSRPVGNGPHYFVDSRMGLDTFDGSKEKPWKTLTHGIAKLKPGDTLFLRGGIYYEHVTIAVAGTAEKPITIRSYPYELAIIDGGLPEFFETPEKAWEPYPDGVAGEFRSTQAYPDLGAVDKGFNTHAYFGDSMVPMQGYRFITDLRDPSMAWDINNKTSDEDGGVYCGPGVFYDVKTGRFHARLAHTNLKALGDDNYRGVIDPRKLPIVLAVYKRGSTLTIRDSNDLRLQDLVVRGSSTATIEVSDSARVVFDGLTVYSGQTAFRVKDTAGLRILHTACRGIAAPWTFRGHLKYRAAEARIFSASGWSPTGRDNRDFELAYCEFTDSVDGVFIGNVKGVHFHHNLIDNISDDGIFLTSGTGYDGITHGGDVFIYQNVLSRCLTTFAFGVGHGRQKTLPTGKQTGSGVYIFRNVFDFRRPVMYQFPASPDGTEELPSKGRFASDHGSPAWEPMNIYHNTIIADGSTGYDYGTFGLTGGLRGGNTRRVFNNIVVQLTKFPSTALIKPSPDLEIDGNLFWSAAHGSTEDFLAKFRKSKNNVPGLGVHDHFADPKFVKFNAEWKAPLDLRLEKSGAGIDAGITIADNWPDPLRTQDKNKPDAGALPFGGEAWHVGVKGRLTMFGELQPTKESPVFVLLKFADVKTGAYRSDVKPAAIVEGYPELDAPVVDYVLKREGIRVDRRERAWLNTADYMKYQLVVIAGDLSRATIKPDRYTKEDVEKVRKFLEDGGTLMLLRRGKRVFDWSPEGQKFLQNITGRKAEREKDPKIAMVQPMHPWVKHLELKEYSWLTWRPDNDNAPLRVSKGEPIIASSGGTCLLYRLPVGKGQLIYMGWQTADLMPHGRVASTVDQEKAFEEQVKIFANIVKDVYPPSK